MIVYMAVILPVTGRASIFCLRFPRRFRIAQSLAASTPLAMLALPRLHMVRRRCAVVLIEREFDRASPVLRGSRRDAEQPDNRSASRRGNTGRDW